MISAMQRARHPFNASSIAQEAALAALDDHEHVNKSRKVNREGLAYLLDELGKLGISYTPTYTNFILIDLKKDPMPLYNALLREGVIVRPVGGYGLMTHLRVTIGLPVENERFVRAMKKVMNT
jgi:histidinol-phosphate aminotransferase